MREAVRRFYDLHGWKKDAASRRYLGEILHEDPDDRVQRYMESNERRYYRYFDGGGRLFLDAGSGSKPRVWMSRRFDKHVCADISIVGLQEARQQLGGLGLYVACDLAALPFKDKAFDGVLASHCLYHIDRHAQPAVLDELYRVAKPERNVITFYRAKYSLLPAAKALVKALLRLLTAFRFGPRPAPLYFHRHHYGKLVRRFPSVEVTCLRTLTRTETTLLRKLRLLNPAIAALSFLEKTFPRAMVWVGEYVTIRIQRPID